MGFCRKFMEHVERARLAPITLFCVPPGKMIDEASEAGQALWGFARAEDDAAARVEQGITFICLSTPRIFSKRLLEMARR